MKNKRQIGITLVALVVTIIILLILAGITISQLAGSDLFENAKLAKEIYENSQNSEQRLFGQYENAINKKYENSNKTVAGTREGLTQEEVEALIDTKLESYATKEYVLDGNIYPSLDYELIGEGSITDTSSAITLNENKKISDYKFLLFRAHLNGKTNNDAVDNKIIPAVQNWYTSIVITNTSSSIMISLYANSDTTIATNNFRSNTENWKSEYVMVYGIK